MLTVPIQTQRRQRAPSKVGKKLKRTAQGVQGAGISKPIYTAVRQPSAALTQDGQISQQPVSRSSTLTLATTIQLRVRLHTFRH